MSFINLPIAIVLLGLIILRCFLSSEGKQNTRLLTVALAVGVLGYTAAGLNFLVTDPVARNGLMIVADSLYVLFFLLLAMHYTNRNLPLVPFWLGLSLVYLAILLATTLIFFDSRFDTPAYAELIRTLLFLTATLAFVTINQSDDMLNAQPVFWIPTLIVATGFGIATGGKVVSTLVHFSGGSFAGLLSTISSLLGVVATLLLLIFLGANINWFRRTT